MERGGFDPVAQAIADAKNLIETATLPPPAAASSLEATTWRLRPSQQRALAIAAYTDPPPVWGLRVNLSSLYCGPEHCNTIARSMILCRTVTSLDLSQCDMQTDAAVHLFGCLKRNTVLKHLNVNGNHIGAPGGVAAATVVGQLETLHIGCNAIGDDGALALASATAQSATLKFLNVRSNGISELGLLRLIEALDPTVAARLPAALLARVAEIQAERDAAAARVKAAAEAAERAKQPGSPTLESRLSEAKAAIRRAMSTDQLTRLSVTDATTTVPSSSDAATAPAPAAAATVDGSRPHNTTVNAMWIQLNPGSAPELFEQLNILLAARYPQPPEGYSSKRKKKSRSASPRKK